MINEIHDKAKEAAYKLRDECDGSSVGAETEFNMQFAGETVLVRVVAFWEKSFWGEYSAKSKSIDDSGDIYF